MKFIEIYTGTSVRGPRSRPGKICYVLWTMTSKGEARIGKTEEAEGTENCLELLALEHALEHIRAPCEIHVYTESSFVSAGWDAGWIRKWEQSGWKTSRGKDVQFAETWKECDRLTRGSVLHFHLKEAGRLGGWVEKELKEEA